MPPRVFRIVCRLWYLDVRSHDMFMFCKVGVGGKPKDRLFGLVVILWLWLSIMVLFFC